MVLRVHYSSLKTEIVQIFLLNDIRENGMIKEHEYFSKLTFSSAYFIDIHLIA